MSMRIGQGFDAHKFVADRPLVLGGVTIPYHLGLEAHSDGDVVIHALCDALLGAAGLSDIGQHFPDTQQQYKNIDSRMLLKNTQQLLEKQQFQIDNVDITVIAQAPKLSSYREAMCLNLAADLKLETASVNVKATTTELMGFTGRGEGIAALAVALITKMPEA